MKAAQNPSNERNTVPKIRVVNENGECACLHHEFYVCAACFDATPGLVNVYETVYRWNGGAGWSAEEIGQITAGALNGVRVSPGSISTIIYKGYCHDCGDVWEERNSAVVICPECHSRNVTGVASPVPVNA